jgi:hypothetical protein
VKISTTPLQQSTLQIFLHRSDACCSVMMHQVSMTSKNRAQEQKQQQRTLLGLMVECGVPDHQQQAMISKTLRILDTEF